MALSILAGHGGLRPGPENTPAGVRSALALGVDGVHVDVRRTADGILVCTRSAVTRRGEPVSERTAEQVADDGVATLAEVLDAAGGARVVCELRNGPEEPGFDAPRNRAVDLLLELLVAWDMADVWVASRDWFAVEKARDVGGGRWPTAFVAPAEVPLSAAAAYAGDAGHAGVCVHVDRLVADATVVQRARSRGLAVAGWGVTSAAQAVAALDAAADAVVCDDPAPVVAAVSRRSSERRGPS